MAKKEDLFVAMTHRFGMDLRSENETETQLRMMLRVPQERWSFLIPVLHALLVASDSPTNAWKVDISKNYLVRNNKILYGWRFIFQAVAGRKLADCYPHIIKTINSAPRPARVELESIVLPGYTKGQLRGGVDARGKGASASGTLPLALTRRT